MEAGDIHELPEDAREMGEERREARTVTDIGQLEGNRKVNAGALNVSLDDQQKS